MNTLIDMEVLCQRILAMLEHDDLRSGNLVTLSDTLARLRSDLARQLADRRAAASDTPELRSAEDALRKMTADVLWLQEYAGVKPIMGVSQKLRMASLRALRVVNLLQDVSEETIPGRSHIRGAPLAAR